MDYLLDSNVVSDLMEGHPKVEARLHAAGQADQIFVMAVVRGEIRFGLEKLPQGKRRVHLTQEADRVFASMLVLQITDAVADEFGRLKQVQLSSGFALAEHDLWIAATALVYGATVVTRDKDFSRVNGLLVEDWSV